MAENTRAWPSKAIEAQQKSSAAFEKDHGTWSFANSSPKTELQAAS